MKTETPGQERLIAGCNPRLGLLALCLFGLLLTSSTGSGKNKLYFPPNDGDWETIDPAAAGWDPVKLEKFIKSVGAQRSSGLLILLNGKILAEKYWPPENYVYGENRMVRMMHGVDRDGHGIEDVASVQKSIAALIVGIAQAKGLLSLRDPVHRYLGAGWSRATREQEEKITVQHPVSMSSGLKDDLSYEAPAGTRWRYNTTAYSHAMHVAAAASGLTAREMVVAWLGKPLGMQDSDWIFRDGMEDADIRDTNIFGFTTTNRDLARVGLMVLAGGTWQGKTILSDRQYLHALAHPSQDMNPSYGYLWWLNGQAVVRGGDRLEVENGPLIKEAPADLFAAQGALQRKLYIVPSMNLVVTRLGNQPRTNDFNNQFWKGLMAAAPE